MDHSVFSSPDLHFSQAEKFQGTILFRGSNPSDSIDEQIKLLKSGGVHPSIPDDVITTKCGIPLKGRTIPTTSFVANSTAVQHSFAGLLNQLSDYFRRRPHFGPYSQEEMSEMEVSGLYSSSRRQSSSL
jgi:tubulin beta